MRVLAVHIVDMKSCCQSVLSEIVKSKQGRKSSPSHTAHDGTLLRVKAVWPYSLVPQEVQGLVLVRIIGLLKNSDIIHTALMQISVFILIYRVDFYSDIFKVLLCNFYCLTDVLYI